MAKASPEKWEKAKALYEKGASLRDIEAELDIPYKTIDNRAKVKGWVKGILAQHIADAIRVKEEFGTMNLAQQDVVSKSVSEAIARREWLDKANMIVAQTVMKKLSMDKSEASYQDLNAASTTLGRTKDNVFGKSPDVAVQVNNQLAQPISFRVL